MSAAKKSSLKRPVYEMPEFVAAALREHKVLKLTKPALRTNGTTTWGWITRAKLEATRQKRLNQMLSELKGGKLYMNMQHNSKQRTE